MRSRFGNQGAEQLLRRTQQPLPNKRAVAARGRPRNRLVTGPPLRVPVAKSPVTRGVLAKVAALAAGTRAQFLQRMAARKAATLARAAQAQEMMRAALGQQLAATRARFAAARAQSDAGTAGAIARVRAQSAAKQAALEQSQAAERSRADAEFGTQEASVRAMGDSYAARAQQTADEVATDLHNSVVGKAEEARTIGRTMAQAGGEPGVAEAKSKVANEIAADTADKVMGGIGDGGAQIRATGPEAAAGFRDQASGIATQLGEGKGGVLAQLVSLYQGARTALLGTASASEQQLATAQAQTRAQLATAEAQARSRLTASVEQSAGQTESAIQQGVGAIDAQAATAATAADTRIGQMMGQVAAVDLPKDAADAFVQRIGDQLGGAYDGLGENVAGAAEQLGAKAEAAGGETIAGAQKAADDVGAQIDQSAATASAGVAKQSQQVAVQMQMLTGQVSTAGSSTVAQVATQLGQKVGEIDAGFGKGVADYRSHLSTNVNDASAKANEPVSTLNSRISDAQRKAEERAKKGFFERQWDDFKEMVSDPGFWVGLVVGLLLAAIVVALIVSSVLTGGLAIILVFALVGAIAAGLGSIVSQATGGQFGNGFDLGRVDWGQVGIAVLLGAAGAAILTGLVLWMGPAFAATLGGLAVISLAAGAITIVTNLITGQPWDKNLLANMTLAFALGWLFKTLMPGKGGRPAPPVEDPDPVPVPTPRPKPGDPPDTPPDPPDPPRVVPGKAQLVTDVAAAREEVAGVRQKVNRLGAGDRGDLEARTTAAEQEVARLQAEADAATSQRRVDALRERLNALEKELDSIQKNPLIELGLRQAAIEAIRSMENIKADPVGDINQVGNKNHYGAARREAGGEVVARRADGRPFDHIQDLQQAYNGLDRVRGILDAEQRNPPGSMTERGLEVLLKRFSEVQSLQSRLKGFLDSIGHGPPYPPFHQWPPGT